jgi:Zn-dependent protease
VLLFSLSVHESAHAWTALQEGDPTAHSRGRISLNPLRHIEPIGTVVLPLLMIFTGASWLIGWAKPTPVDPRYFKDLKRGQIIVSGAGPTSNLMLAVLFTAGLFLALRVVPEPSSDNPLFDLLVIGIKLNVVLTIFNLVPLPPLDGSHILQWVLPNGMGHRFVRLIGPYGGIILLLLVVTGAFWTVIGPVVAAIVESLIAVARFQ